MSKCRRECRLLNKMRCTAPTEACCEQNRTKVSIYSWMSGNRAFFLPPLRKRLHNAATESVAFEEFILEILGNLM